MQLVTVVKTIFLVAISALELSLCFSRASFVS
jgi:hypothetical protein